MKLTTPLFLVKSFIIGFSFFTVAFAQGNPSTTPYSSYINPNVNAAYSDWRLYNLEEEYPEEVYGNPFLLDNFYKVKFVIDDTIQPMAKANYNTVTDEIIVLTEDGKKVIVDGPELFKSFDFSNGLELIYLNDSKNRGYFEKLAECDKGIYIVRKHTRTIMPEQHASGYRTYRSARFSEIKEMNYVYDRTNNKMFELSGSTKNKLKTLRKNYPNLTKSDLKNWVKSNNIKFKNKSDYNLICELF